MLQLGGVASAAALMDDRNAEPERWTEVAYCQECRAAFYWHNPRYLLHPIQPKEIRRDMK
jgi:hypothetical protein